MLGSQLFGKTSKWTGLVLALLAAAPAVSPAQDTVPVPKVTGPIAVTRASHPFLSTEINLAAEGYVEKEYFVEGTARRYNGAEVAGERPFRTRIMVRRPLSAQKFNGLVDVEWVNITGGYDLEFDWFSSHEFFTRKGWTWVGVSAQRLGVEALKSYNSARYGTLDVGTAADGDAYAADIFAQSAKALLRRQGSDPLAGLAAQRLIASGDSQSADKLALYHNDQHPVHRLFDGFLIRGFNRPLRADLSTKAMRVLTETDVSPAMQALSGVDPSPDNDHYRRWEVAATSHVTYKENREYEPLVVRDRGSALPRQCAKPPFSQIPYEHTLNAAFDHLGRWIEGGPAPPASPRIQMAPDGINVARDERGFGIGGIRLPELAVPVALDTGENQGVTLCPLWGSHEAFDQATLQALYPDRAAYVAKVEAAIRDSVARGYLLPEDAEVTCRRARLAEFGWPSPQPPVTDLGCTRLAASPSSSASSTPAAGSALGLPATRRCASRRRLTIRVRAPRGQRLRSAVISIDGRRVRRLTGRRLRGRVDLRGLPAGTVRVTIVARTTSGRRIVETRRYRTCSVSKTKKGRS